MTSQLVNVYLCGFYQIYHLWYGKLMELKYLKISRQCT